MRSNVQHRNLFLFGALAVFGLMVLSCGCTSKSPDQERQPVIFTQENSSSLVNVPLSSNFAIQLEANPTTGYSWNNVTLSPGLELISAGYKEKTHPEGMVGVGGTSTWIINAKDAGDQTFSTVYRRQWEPVTGNELNFTLTVRVSKT
jgi:predicted secreted protein